jgi:isopenicillin-N epimerase
MTLDHVADRTGARLVEVALPLPAPDPAAIVEAVADALRPGVRLAVLDHVTSPSALVLPIAELIARCRDNGAMVLVDGAHAPGMLDLDVAAFGADWYAGNCHKWMLAPRGCGFLWARADRAAGIHPTAISHFYNQGFEAEFDWTGTRDVSAWLSVGAAIDYLESHDLAAARRYCHDLVLDRAARVARDLGTAVAGPEAMIGAMAAVRVPTSAPATYDAGIAISDRIWHRHRVEIPVRPVAGALWARLSAQVYNTPEDYDGLAAHIAEAASDRQP